MLIPKNRHEYYLAVISGNDYPTFPPKTREELYLAKLAGREVDVPTPRTPKERAYYNIINDIKFEPENRWQIFVAAANDDNITAPVPITREEIWWTNISLSHEVIVEYIGTLPATLQTVEGYLESYKIYGNTVQDGTPTPENPIVPSGCGERTENLFNANRLPSNTWTIDEKYYTKGVAGDDKSTIRPNTLDVSISNSGDLTVLARSYFGAGFVVAVTPETTYTLSFKTDIVVPSSKSVATMTYVDSDENFIYYITMYGGTSSVTFTTPDTAYYILISFRYTNGTITYSNIMLNLGSTALPYEPYGYELDITTSKGTTEVTTPIYIGSTPLEQGEYVDYGEQKVYKYVDGVLTPTDPPVELPAIPTLDGTTVIDIPGNLIHYLTSDGRRFDAADGTFLLAGSAPAPDKLYVKYRKGGT